MRTADDARTAPRPRSWHPARDTIRLYFGLTLLGALCLLWSLFAVPLYWIMPRRPGCRLGRLAVHVGFRMYLRILVIIGAGCFDLSALDELRGQPPMIIALNHPSLLDAVMVISRLPGLACIMKANILDNVFLGAGARLARYIRNDAARRMIESAIADLGAGSSLLLFPEGTRTGQPPIGKLSGSVGLIAKLAQVPVQTVLIETNSRFLGKGWPLFRCPMMPVTYRLRLGRRFAPPGDAGAFVAELEQYFTAALAGAQLSALAARGAADG